MESQESSAPGRDARAPRKPRSDGRRNRERIVSVAREAFARDGVGASLDDIAKRAGVGSGTLYRHFPSRESLVEAVFRAEVQRLAEAAEGFAQSLPPAEALRAWLLLFVDYLAAKRVVAAAFNGLDGGNRVFEEGLSSVQRAVDQVYGRAVASGDLRPDIEPKDHLRALLGITSVGTSEEWSASAARLVDVLILGSRPQ